MKPLSETPAERLERISAGTPQVEGGMGSNLVGGGLLFIALTIVVVGLLMMFALTGIFGGYNDMVRELTPQP